MAEKPAVAVIVELMRAARDCGLSAREAILFGSFARGEEHEWSDIDAVVLVDDSLSDREVWQTEISLNVLAMDIDARLEILALRESDFAADDPSPLICAVQSEGIRVAA